MKKKKEVNKNNERKSWVLLGAELEKIFGVGWTY
jgi:hypothetical protein